MADTLFTTKTTNNEISSLLAVPYKKVKITIQGSKTVWVLTPWQAKPPKEKKEKKTQPQTQAEYNNEESFENEDNTQKTTDPLEELESLHQFNVRNALDYASLKSVTVLKKDGVLQLIADFKNESADLYDDEALNGIDLITELYEVQIYDKNPYSLNSVSNKISIKELIGK